MEMPTSHRLHRDSARLSEHLPGNSNSQGEEQMERVQGCTAAGLNTKPHPNPASRLSSDPSTPAVCMWLLAQALAP